MRDEFLLAVGEQDGKILLEGEVQRKHRADVNLQNWAKSVANNYVDNPRRKLRLSDRFALVFWALVENARIDSERAVGSPPKISPRLAEDWGFPLDKARQMMNDARKEYHGNNCRSA